MQRFRLRLFVSNRASRIKRLSSQRERLRLKLSWSPDSRPARQSSLFALVVLLMLFGIIIGWGGKNVFSSSSLIDYIPRSDIAFTPGTDHPSMHTRIHDTADQISTNFDSSSGRLSRIIASDSTQLTKQSLTPTITVTVDPAALSAHMITGSRLQIPKLSIDAPIETVGMRQNGHMDVPLLNVSDGVGLYQNGIQPGQIGSAIVDGYGIRQDGSPAVFKRLGELHPGDRILVVNQDGSEQRFHVVTLQRYKLDQVPVAHIFEDMSGAYLNLITCDGDWMSPAQQTKEPLIVYAALD
jgi:sortase (surface protein transpeptidase)